MCFGEKKKYKTALNFLEISVRNLSKIVKSRPGIEEDRSDNRLSKKMLKKENIWTFILKLKPFPIWELISILGGQ